MAKLGPGTYFGEEALLNNAKRNATVAMATKGVLMRMNKENFEEFLKQPRLAWVSRIQALDEITKGAIWLDVRTPPEFARNSLPNAISLPLKDVRVKAKKTLDTQALYLCCCQTGRLSATAAFLLSQLGYKVAVLRGGLQRFPGFQGDGAA